MTTSRVFTRTTALRGAAPRLRWRPRSLALVVALGAAFSAHPPRAHGFEEVDAPESPRLAAVRVFLDNVLAQGRDRWSGEETPLLADGLNVLTGEPVEWVYEAREGRGGTSARWIVHNLANQQRLLRTLVAFANLTDEAKYSEAARASVRYHFEHLRSECGLFYWGTYQFIDLRTLRPVDYRPFTPSARTRTHQLRHVLPFYELMWEVDPKATTALIEAQWNAQVRDWSTLDLSSHAAYGLPRGPGWASSFASPPPFFESTGLTAMSSGLDLIYGAASLHALSGDPAPFVWARHLAGLYVSAAHPLTGINATRYNRYPRTQKPPASGPIPNRIAMGDRAENQLGAAFPEVAREGWALFRQNTYGPPVLAQLELAERLGPAGRPFLTDTVANLKAYSQYAYDADAHRFRPIWADGTDLTGYTLPRTGYYGRKGTVLKPYPPAVLHFLAYARAFRLSPDPALWNVVRAMGRGFALGEFGASPDVAPVLDFETAHSRPEVILILLELHRATGAAEWLRLAEVVGNNLLERSFHDGFFLLDRHHLHARFDALEPYALLALEAAVQGRPEAVPPYSGGRNHLQGWFAGLGRTYDNEAIWSLRKPSAPSRSR